MHGGSRDLPALVNFESFNQDLKISWHNNGPDNQEFFAAEGCSVLYKGTNYLFGGWFENQDGEKTYGPHVLDVCEILKAPGASFQFDCFDGSVGYLPSEEDQEDYIMLYDGFNSVQGYDGSNILEIDFAPPVDFHREIGGQIPLYENHPILIAGYRTASVERYSPFNGWVKDDNIAFPEKNLYSYSAVWGDFGVVVFPGNTETGEIWRLSDDEWTSIGTLPWKSILRFSRAVLLSNFEAMVFGGNENQKFTKFTFNDHFSSIESEYLSNLPSLNYWGDPFAILVPDNYCLLSFI
ncbi:Oidioi.mRNA.OKI2018_I69.chr1.g3777.t1.cds [Oikopleura dioica]|uniref:Oidioi.mRNA.OKI2018_I69.chr1.g3777.t1.cds n=1 Tax=Oikopleura dioica TaxID=34765 RepID=A0ABN7SUY5_OIKDI|nr:Oidioi.mRNA.OKI2018_I69.chr1.g3777.t1.cds [Oikopleura dioica]